MKFLRKREYKKPKETAYTTYICVNCHHPFFFHWIGMAASRNPDEVGCFSSDNSCECTLTFEQVLQQGI